MKASLRGRHIPLAAIAGSVVLFMCAAPAAAHEDRRVGPYELAVGFIDEPVYVGQKSGLEFFVTAGGAPVEGLEKTLKAEVSYQDRKMDLPLSPRFGEEGAYQSVFFPTAAGPYTFRIFGTIDSTRVDESFTSSPEGFDEVREAQAGQFPVQFPVQGELVAQARRGSEAAGQVPIALGLGGAGLLAGLAALGVAAAARPRST